MNTISVREIKIIDNKVTVSFDVSKELKKYFRLQSMDVTYMEAGKCIDLTKIPESLLIIPWICNVLPITWLTNATINVPAIDEDFYNSIADFKQGYKEMYPQCTFSGQVIAKKVEKNIVSDKKRVGKSGVFFSGGVDAYYTLIRHHTEKPCLMTIWGADISYNDNSGWQVLNEQIEQIASMLQLSSLSIHSNFRDMVNESVLTETFMPLIHDNWWHGMQHGIGLIGHSAPINYLKGITRQYIAASFWPGAKLTCASWPTIDNCVRFFDCKVVHDGFVSRQEKIKFIVKSHRQNGFPIYLHVCWENKSGKNCCQCEKCCRTIMGLLAEGENPRDYGFEVDNKVLRNCVKRCCKYFDYDFVSVLYWRQIQERVKKNLVVINEKDTAQYLNWLYTFDFEHANQRFCRWWSRLKIRIINKLHQSIRYR